MFNYIKGKIEYVQEGMLVLECGGIGYELFVTNSAVSNNSTIGETAKFFTYFQVREDGISLFGFENLEEKNLFLKLIEVSGIGAKLAMTVLSSMNLVALIGAITNADITTLSSIKGIGKKTAERIALELKDKLEYLPQNDGYNAKRTTFDVDNSIISDATNALIALGIAKGEAKNAVNFAVQNGNTTLESIIQIALKSLY